MEHTQGRRPVFELEEEREAAKIKVIGLGGGGSNAVNRMMAASFTGVDFIVGNTDLQALRSSPAPVKLQLGTRLTGGLGAGSDPEVGKNAALEDREEIKKVLEGADLGVEGIDAGERGVDEFARRHLPSADQRGLLEPGQPQQFVLNGGLAHRSPNR